MEIPATLLRPFRADELAEVPRPWRIGPPDFVGIGCGKAGSSWWHRLVGAHPQVVRNRVKRKELHYFPHLGWRRPSWSEIDLYRQAFARPQGSICGEWSGNYLYYPFALEALAEAAPGAKLIAMVRNPVDRMLSCLNQYVGSRSELITAGTDERTLLETWSFFPEAAYQCRIAESLSRAIKLFGREQLLVLQYETCAADPENELERTYDFLGIDPSHRPDDISRTVNQRPYVTAAPDAADRRRIAEWFADDVRALEALIGGLDLSRWPEFAPATATAG